MTDTFEQIINIVNALKLDIKKRDISNGTEKITLLFISQIVDTDMLVDDIIKPISLYIGAAKDVPVNARDVFDSAVFSYDFFIGDKADRIIGYILKGMAVAVFSNDSEYIVMNIRKVENRGVETPELAYTLRGPRDCLNENIDVSLSLLRYRIKDPKLNIDMLEVGRRTKTGIAVVHIADIANTDIVKEITDRIRKIDVDGIIDSGELQNLILNRKASLFPQMGVIERSDMVAGALLEGKVVVLVEGSALALVGPKVFSEFFESCEDNYDNRYYAAFAKYIRLMAAFTTLTITALYIAILNFHADALPVNFVIFINNTQHGVPLSILIGAVILEVLVETIRESMLRVPRQIGPAAGIVATIVLGQAVILAKVFSPLNLVIAAISLLSSFVSPDYTVMNPLRVLKFFLIALSGTFGLVGFTVGISIITVGIVSADTFGVPYLAPFAPFNRYDFKSAFIHGKDVASDRPNFLKTKDKTHFKNKKGN